MVYEPLWILRKWIQMMMMMIHSNNHVQAVNVHIFSFLFFHSIIYEVTRMQYVYSPV